MKSEFVVALVVVVTVAAHIALYRWVRFKIHEGVILKFLREGRGSGDSRFQPGSSMLPVDAGANGLLHLGSLDLFLGRYTAAYA